MPSSVRPGFAGSRSLRWGAGASAMAEVYRRGGGEPPRPPPPPPHTR